MPIFKLLKTKCDAIWVSDKRQSPKATEIKEAQDLPPMEIWEQVNVPPEILIQGRMALSMYLRAFFGDYPETYCVWVFPSAFPGKTCNTGVNEI